MRFFSILFHFLSLLGSIIQIDDTVMEFRQNLEALQGIPSASSGPTDLDALVQIPHELKGDSSTTVIKSAVEILEPEA